MKRLILTLVLCLPAWAADHYVDCAVTGPGSGTLADPWKTIASLSAHTMAADDFAYLKRGCTWAEQLTPGQSGTSGHPITYDAYGPGTLPVLTGGTRAIYVNGKSYLLFRNIEARNVIGVLGSTAGVIFNSMVARDGTGKGFDMTAGSITVNNCLIAGYQSSGISLATAGNPTMTLTNSIVVGNGAGTDWIGNGNYGATIGSGSTFNYQNNVISGNGRTVGANVYGTGTKNDLGGNLIDVAPQFKSWANPTTYFTFAVDGDGAATVDTNGTHLLSILPAGTQFTLFLPWVASLNNLPTIAGFVAQGVELAAHGRTHPDLTKTTAFALTSTNAAPTIDVDVPTKTLTLHCTTSPQCDTDITLTWSVTEKTITDLKAAVVGKGWTVTTGTGTQDAEWLSTLADTTGAQAVPYSPLWDMTARYTAEILYPMQWIIDNLSYTPVTYAYPNGSSDAAVKEFCRLHDDVVLGSRGVVGGSMGLSKVAIQEIVGYSLASNVLTGLTTEAETRAAARHYYLLGRAIGGVIVFFYHFTDVSDAQMLWFVDEMRVQGVTFVTFRTAIEAIRADHATTDAGATWTKTYTDAADFRAQKCPSDTTRYIGCYTGTDLGAAYKMGLDPRNPGDVQPLDRTWFGWDPGPYVRIKRKVVGN